MARLLALPPYNMRAATMNVPISAASAIKMTARNNLLIMRANVPAARSFRLDCYVAGSIRGEESHYRCAQLFRPAAPVAGVCAVRNVQQPLQQSHSVTALLLKHQAPYKTCLQYRPRLPCDEKAARELYPRQVDKSPCGFLLRRFSLRENHPLFVGS
jgi:hypothetical protein